MGRIVFITATDTGAGKTLLTAMCVSRLLATGKSAVAIKPFCSGSHDDVELLYRAQKGQIPKNAINPFYIEEAVAPLVGLRRSRRTVSMDKVNRHIDQLGKGSDWLLIEGIGGLMTPLGKGYDFEDLICARDCGALVVVPNRLGALSHTLLVINSLRRRVSKRIAVVLMSGIVARDAACRTNNRILRELLRPVPVFSLPYFGPNSTSSAARISSLAKKNKKILAQVLGAASLSTALVNE